MTNEVWADVHLGKVVSSSRWSQTHVSSSGGGGRIVGGTGYIAAPTIESSTSDKNEVFSISSDGQESRFVFENRAVGFREGNRILVAWGSETGSKNGQYYYLENLDTGEKSDHTPEAPGGIGCGTIISSFILSVIFGWLVFMLSSAGWDKYVAEPKFRQKAMEQASKARYKYAEYAEKIGFLRPVVESCLSTGQVRFEDLGHTRLYDYPGEVPIFEPALKACWVEGVTRNTKCACPLEMVSELKRRTFEANEIPLLKERYAQKLVDLEMEKLDPGFYPGLWIGLAGWVISLVVMLRLMGSIAKTQVLAARRQFFQLIVDKMAELEFKFSFDSKSPIKLVRGKF